MIYFDCYALKRNQAKLIRAALREDLVYFFKFFMHNHIHANLWAMLIVSMQFFFFPSCKMWEKRCVEPIFQMFWFFLLWKSAFNCFLVEAQTMIKNTNMKYSTRSTTNINKIPDFICESPSSIVDKTENVYRRHFHRLLFENCLM